MISDEKRREVAQELRELRHITHYSEEVVENIRDVISIADPVNTFREPEDVYKLLADLIDRQTCYVVEHKTHCGSYGCEEAVTLWVLSCGDECVNDSDFPPRYCPECGAMVTEESGRNVREL